MALGECHGVLNHRLLDCSWACLAVHQSQRYWHFVRIPLTKGQSRGKRLHVETSSFMLNDRFNSRVSLTAILNLLQNIVCGIGLAYNHVMVYFPAGQTMHPITVHWLTDMAE